MGRSAHPTSPWRHLEISFFAGHWSISFQCFGGGSIATWDRAAGEQLMRNLTGTLTAACINPQIMLRPSLIVSTNSTWITKKNWATHERWRKRQLACFFKSFWKEVPLIISESMQLRNMQVMTGNTNVSIVVGGNGNHQSPQTCVSSSHNVLPTANSKRHAATGRPHTHPDLDLNKLGKKEEKGEEDRGQLGRERASGRENIVTVHTQNHVCLSVFFWKLMFFLKAFNSISGSHNFHNGCQPTFAFSWNFFSQCRMWKWLERPAAKVRRTVWCDVSTILNASKFKYESAWTIQRQIDVTKSKIRWGTKLYFHFSSTCCCQHSPGAAEPWSESSCREGDAEAQRSFRWLAIPTAGAVRAAFWTLTGLRLAGFQISVH